MKVVFKVASSALCAGAVALFWGVGGAGALPPAPESRAASADAEGAGPKPRLKLKVANTAQGATLRLDGVPQDAVYRVHASPNRKSFTLEVDAQLGETPLEAEVGSGLIERLRPRRRAEGLIFQIEVASPATHQATLDGGELKLDFKTFSQTSAKALLVAVHTQHVEARDRIELSFDDLLPYDVTQVSRRTYRLQLSHARALESLARDFLDSDLNLVERIELLERGDALFVDVSLKADARQTLIAQGRRLVWLFAPQAEGKVMQKPVAIARERETELLDVVSGYDGVVQDGFIESGAEAAAEGDARSIKKKAPSYSGRTVDLDFKDADIHNILRLLSEIGNVNVITSDDVKGTVTIRMRSVPWDQALDVILQSKGLGMTRQRNLIRVAPLEVLEKEREAAIARQRQKEQLAPLETRLIPVSYATALDLEPRVKELLSGRGTVSVDERTNMLVVRDINENLDDVETLVRTLDTQTPQVLIEARIVEATSQYTRDIGIQWGGDFVMSTATGNPTGLAFPANVGAAGGNFDINTLGQSSGLNPFGPTTQPNFAVNLPALTGTGQGGALGLTLGSLGGTFNLNVRLSAAEANGIVRIVSSPKILTLDNQEASIGQGTLIPFSQVSAQGVQTAFQEAKLELKVRPHVTSDGSIAMAVQVTRDEPDFTRTSNRGDPTILKREAQTNLLVADGHTAVIGGIYTRNTGRNIDQVPFFGDLPILGVLFQRRRMREERGELLIFLTPRIVNRDAALRM